MAKSTRGFQSRAQRGTVGHMRMTLLLSMGLVACRAERTSDISPYLLEQTEFSRVVVSKRMLPNVMLIVDNSSALGDVTDSTSRASQLKATTHALLTDNAPQRWALTTFPEPTLVTAFPPDDDQDLAAPLASHANAIDSAIQALVPSGDTQALAALQFAGTNATPNALDNRGARLVLVTGGLPSGDVQATIDFLEMLYRDRGIPTAIIAVDPDPSAEATFNAMARAGGSARRCTFDACGGGQTCDSDSICSQAFWSAANASTEFAQSLLDSIVLLTSDPCRIQLDTAPGTPEYLSVVVNDVSLEAGPDTYRLEGALLTLTGATCETVHDATVRNPASIHVRAVEKL